MTSLVLFISLLIPGCCPPPDDKCRCGDSCPFGGGCEDPCLCAGPESGAFNAVGRLKCGNSLGSGTVIGPRRTDGRWYVLTAAHVVAYGRPCVLEMKSGLRVRAGVISRDPEYDLAWLITSKSHVHLPHVLLGESPPGPGRRVWHCGYGVSSPALVRRGEVTHERFVTASPVRVAINHGDSGGGLFLNGTSTLVGVVTNGTPDGYSRGPYRRGLFRGLEHIHARRPLPPLPKK